VTAAPQDLEDELEGELDGTIDEDVLDEDLDGDELDESGLPDGFVVEGEDDAVPADSDVGETVIIAVDLGVDDDADEFEDDPVAAVSAEDEDDVPGRRAGEFICTRCYLVKADSQLTTRGKKKICRDCA